MNGVLTQSDEMEKLVSELSRDTEVVTLIQNINEAG
jgi:hypothetical protein